MSNKYIDVICSDNYGASSIDDKMQSAGLGIMIGGVALVAVPAILMASEDASRGRSGSRLFGFFKSRDQRRKEAQDKSMQTLMQGRNRISDSSQAEKDEGLRRMLSAM